MNRRAGLLQAAVSLLCLAAVVWWATRQERPELPDTPGAVGLIVLAIALYAGASLARAERWHRILERAAIPSPRRETYRLTAVGYMGNNTLPARGGDLLRVFLLAPLTGTSRRSVLGSVVAERLLDAIALALIFVAVAYGALRGSVSSGDLPIVAAVAGAVVVLLAAALVALRRAASLAPAREFLRPLAGSTRDLASAHGLGLLALSLGVWALEAAVYLATARAVGLDLGMTGALYVVAITNLSALLPAAPGYVGTFDAAVILAVRSLGNPGNAALGYLLLLRFVLFVPITLVGLAFFLGRYGGWARTRER